MFWKKKPKTGYSKKKIKKENKERKYLSSLITPFDKNISLGERILKFIIYIALRLVIKPSRWKQPERNFEIIDRTYKKITSSDFVFIPSSVAYYLLMSFIPLITIISLMTRIPFLQENNIKENLADVFKGFIPGLDKIWESLEKMKFSAGTFTAFIALLITSLWISSSGFSQLIYTQSHLYKHKYVGGYWMNKIKGIVIVIAFSLFMFTVLTGNFFFIRWINNSSLSGNYKNFIKKTFLYVGLIIFVFLCYIALFKLSPRYKIKIRHVIPGSMVATVPTIIFISIFGIIGEYLSYKRFGYIGTFLYVGLLVLEISYFIFVGLIVNVSYHNTFVIKELKSKRTISRK